MLLESYILCTTIFNERPRGRYTNNTVSKGIINVIQLQRVYMSEWVSGRVGEWVSERVRV